MHIADIFLMCGAYLLGSIPTAVWVGKRFYNIDVREHGSGNAGATNTIRVLGKKAGIPVLLIDVLKGFLAVSLARYSTYTLASDTFINLQLSLGVAVVLGHIFPIFASFRGGKGIATVLGVVIAIHPLGAMISLCLFVLILLLSNYVSLSSMLAALAFPIVLIFVLQVETVSLIIFSVLISVMVIVTHKKNIGRLLRKEEPKAYLFGKKADTPTN
jgi:acyl phosphate:glycerol-3-phosphate acyltransferase